MKKSYQKLIIFDTVLLIIVLLNSFILNILKNYYYMDAFLLLLLIAFKYFFGFEKDHHRYVKDIMINMLIIFLISFIMYYLFGIFIGFYRTRNYLTLYGIRTFFVPYIIMIIMREYLRMQMLNKTEKSKLLTVITCILFIVLEASAKLTSTAFSSNYNIFIFISLTMLPIISNNIVCTYIAKKVGYKPNIFWLLVSSLYLVVFPIVPDINSYIRSLIEFLFPFALMYNVYIFFDKRSKNVPISYLKKRVYVGIYLLLFMVFTLAYFVSGYFRYYAIAIATGSMSPTINVGDVVVVNQKKDYRKLEIGDVIAYKYHDITIVHRLVDKLVIDDEYYFYTKGDANENIDNYVVYPEYILGDVKVKIPGIGIPTIWLNKLFQK